MQGIKRTSQSWQSLMTPLEMTNNSINGMYSNTDIQYQLVAWLVVLRINVDLAIFQPYLDLEAGDNQYLKIQVARSGIEPRSLALQAKSLTTRPPLLPSISVLQYFELHTIDIITTETRIFKLLNSNVIEHAINLKSFLVVYLSVPFYQRVPIPSYIC